jgi:hypothetical protein
MFVLVAILPLALLIVGANQPNGKSRKLVAAIVESTLPTASDKFRQLAFDGDDATYYASANPPGAKDAFTLTFAAPVNVASVVVRTGTPDGSDALESGTVEGSKSGKAFETIAKFQRGEAKGEPNGLLKMIRIKPAPGTKHPLVIREIAVDSEPPIDTFKYPVEFVVDSSDAREMTRWAEKAARLCERLYPQINEELKSDGFKPPKLVGLTMKRGIGPPAYARGDGITGKVEWFKKHPDDFGAMIHETTHIVQHYRGRKSNPNPGWLVEGVADYIRYIRFEPARLHPVKPERAHYNSSYGVTARFLDFVSRKYDKQLVLKLNKAMREGTYTDDLFKELTGKPVQKLDDEWRATLGL